MMSCRQAVRKSFLSVIAERSRYDDAIVMILVALKYT